MESIDLFKWHNQLLKPCLICLRWLWRYSRTSRVLEHWAQNAAHAHKIIVKGVKLIIKKVIFIIIIGLLFFNNFKGDECSNDGRSIYIENIIFFNATKTKIKNFNFWKICSVSRCFSLDGNNALTFAWAHFPSWTMCNRYELIFPIGDLLHGQQKCWIRLLSLKKVYFSHTRPTLGEKYVLVS